MKTRALALLFPVLLFAKTSLWEISKGDNHLFIGGTIHLLRPTDFPLPAEFDSAYNHSETVVFETDLSGLNEPEFQASLLATVRYPEGSSLKSELKPDTYRRLSEYLHGKGIEISAIDQYRPSMISILISQWEMSKYEMAEEGVDFHFFTKAKKDSKTTSELETNEQQIHFIASLGSADPDGLILNSIEESSEMESVIETMISAWKTGDEKSLDKLIIKEMKEKYPAIYQSLLIDRNKNWQPQIERMITTNQVELILVGAGHLVGEKGLLTSLKKAGYSVNQLDFGTHNK